MSLSIVVIFHDMQREAKRTLFGLSASYQRNIEAEDYEVIAIDNSSNSPLNSQFVSRFGDNFRYYFYETVSKSPVDAVNFGADLAVYENIAIIVDGARIASPSIIENTLKSLSLFRVSFVFSLSWHLGPNVQNVSMQSGYNQEEEDKLLASVDWRSDGYKLFEISTLAQSSSQGFLGGMPPECSWFAMPTKAFREVGGFDPRFVSPGGGLVNHDFRNRVLNLPEVQPVSLLGEGVFHQFHGGVATNVRPESHPMPSFQSEYKAIRGIEYETSNSLPIYYFGRLPKAARKFL